MDDDGVSLALGIELCIGGLLQQSLCLIQGYPQTGTETEKPVARGAPAARKNLMKIYFADIGPACKVRLGNGFLRKECCQKLCHTGVGKGGIVVVQIGIEVRFVHQFLL